MFLTLAHPFPNEITSDLDEILLQSEV